MPKAIILEWLTTCVHDLKRASLVEPRKWVVCLSRKEASLTPETARTQLANAINSEVPLVLRTIGECLHEPKSEAEVRAAFTCLDAWVEWGLGAEYVQSRLARTKSDLSLCREITSILPTVYGYLDTPLMPSATATVCEILTVSVFRDGKATRILTEPILTWLMEKGRAVVEDAVARQFHRRPSARSCLITACYRPGRRRRAHSRHHAAHRGSCGPLGYLDGRTG